MCEVLIPLYQLSNMVQFSKVLLLPFTMTPWPQSVTLTSSIRFLFELINIPASVEPEPPFWMVKPWTVEPSSFMVMMSPVLLPSMMLFPIPSPTR